MHQLPLTDEKYFWQLWIAKTSYTHPTLSSQLGSYCPLFYWQTQLSMGACASAAYSSIKSIRQVPGIPMSARRWQVKGSISPHLKKNIRICGWMLPSAQVCWQTVQMQISSACAPCIRPQHQTAASTWEVQRGVNTRWSYFGMFNL